MDNSERKINIPPLVHLLPKTTKIGGTNVLLISDSEGNKYQIEYKDFLTQLVKDLIELLDIKKQEPINITNVDIIKALESTNSINFVKPLNIANNKIIEQDTKDIGTIYFNGEEIRVLGKNGWISK